MSPDARRLVFSSNRPVEGDPPKASNRDFDLWMVERTPTGWSEPRPLISLNTPDWEMHSAMTRDGTLYFGRFAAGNYDIWRARYEDGFYHAPERLPAPVNTPSVEYDPFIDPDERYIVFGSDRQPDSIGGADLYVSFNDQGVWSAPVNLGARVNTRGREAGGFIFRNGGRAHLVFNSETGRELGATIRPDDQLGAADLERILSTADNQLRNFYSIDLCAVDVDDLR